MELKRGAESEARQKVEGTNATRPGQSALLSRSGDGLNTGVDHLIKDCPNLDESRRARVAANRSANDPRTKVRGEQISGCEVQLRGTGPLPCQFTQSPARCTGLWVARNTTGTDSQRKVL